MVQCTEAVCPVFRHNPHTHGFRNARGAQVDRLFNLMDADGSGDVDFKEFATVIMVRHAPKPLGVSRQTPGVSAKAFDAARSAMQEHVRLRPASRAVSVAGVGRRTTRRRSA
jgi:hypothetical protein